MHASMSDGEIFGAISSPQDLLYSSIHTSLNNLSSILTEENAYISHREYNVAPPKYVAASDW